jgi:response regulator RpfG family c-di-GMP phosphodiesterase
MFGSRKEDFLYRTVYLLDDSAPDNILHERLLKQTQFAKNVHVFTDSDACLAHLTYLSSNSEQDLTHLLPEIICLDLNMPFRNGWYFIERFAELTAKLPVPSRIVVLSHVSDPEEIQRLESHPNVALFLPKPLSKDHLYKLKNRIPQRR